MGEKGHRRRMDAEIKKRRRESVIIIVAALLIVFVTYIETHVSILGSKLPLSHNLLVFGLININIILVVLLIFLVLRNFIKLFFDRRKGIIGSRLRTKLVAAFVSLTLIPTFLLFFIAIGFITKGIEGWFGVDIEDSLRESLEVAQTYYREISDKTLYFSRQISSEIGGRGGLSTKRLDSIRSYIAGRLEENGLGAVEVFDKKGRRIISVLSQGLSPTLLPVVKKDLIERGLQGEGFSDIASTPEGDVIRGIAPISNKWEPKRLSGVVVVSQYIPTSLMAKMQDIARSVEEYRQLKVLKDPVKTSYSIILLIITLVIVFLSTWIGFHMAKGITTPIQSLADGTHAVAMGNLDYRIEGESSDDEIGVLVRSFNTMTEDLKKAYTDLKKTNLELDQRRQYMEIVLKNVAAGVVSIDKSGRITTINRAAEEILEIKTGKVLGRHYKEVMKSEHLELIREMIREMNSSSMDTIERQLKLEVKDRRLNILFNLTILKDDDNNYMGMVAVFDDLTNLIKAQRMIAWKEVARRIAHEIKNPLTPIKLSAQRLQKKYSPDFLNNGRVFKECTDMIIKQVDELKALVDEFSNFARMPAANPKPNNLNDVIKDALALYNGAHKGVEFESCLDDSTPVMEIDREQIKRAIINLLENSIDSMNGGRGRIRVETSYDRSMNIVRIEVADTGCGIPVEDRSRLFEPYFSTKKTGTGLGLAIVSNIVADHHGYIRVKDNKPVGTRFIIELPVRS